jgi:diguanylate cyclase (GGDEF)-like protein
MVARPRDSSRRPYDGTESEKDILGSVAPPSPDDAPAPPPAVERRAPGDPLDEALAACAALAPRLAALPELGDRTARRQALLQLPAALQAAGLALARLEACGGDPERPAGGADALTGLADRAELAAASAALALQYPDTPLMLLAADVDHLRHVNDTWSRATGDAVLQAVAGVLRAQSRPQDVLARADGNLFVVALGGPVSTTRALLVAERLRAAIEGHAWMAVGSGLRVTASIGVAARAPGESLDDVLGRAGAALQECKRSGRNQVRSRA